MLESFIDECVEAYNLDLFRCVPPSEAVESVVTPLPSNGADYVNNGVPISKAVGKAKGGEGMRQALDIYKRKFPHISAILIGTRRGDPHGGQLPINEISPRLTIFDRETISSEYDRRRLAPV